MSNWEIKTEQINDDYYWGEFGGFRVIVREEDGYINGSRMIVTTGKRFNDWTRNKQTKELVREIAEHAEIPACDLMEAVNRGVTNELRGTYVHPDLIIHLAQWCSPAYAVKVSHIVQDYHAREHRREQKRLKKQVKRAKQRATKAEEKVEKKRVKISELKAQLDEMLEMGHAQLRQLDRQDAKLDRTHDQLDRTNRQLGQANHQLDRTNRQLGQANHQLDAISTKLDVARHDRVVLTRRQRDKNVLYILQLYDRHRRSLFNHYVIRGKGETIQGRVNKVIQDYPEARVIHRIEYTPNSIILWLRYQQEYGQHIVKSGNHFDWTDVDPQVGLAKLDWVHASRMGDVEV